ncbi:MAG: DUF4838 domain-containing protein [Clostridiales bacterium]|nr:DUF4838 domain-containing protein [Clostridiales bacterium]
MRIDKTNFLEYGVLTDGTPSAEFAKEELQNFIEKACGFRLNAYNGQAHYISLGENEYSKSIIDKYDTSDLNEEGFYILSKGGNVYLFGASQKSVIFSVYEFLEKYLGIRFVASDCCYTPKADSLEIPEEEVKRVPISPQRLYLSYAGAKDKLLSLRYKFSADFTPDCTDLGIKNKWYTKIPTSHNSNCYVPYEKYKDSHPEFFNVFRYNLFRTLTEVELCYSNGLTEEGEWDESVETSVLSVATDSMMRFMEDDPSAEYFMFGRADNEDCRCRCPRCERAREKYGDAGIMIVFMNAMAKKLRQSFAKQGKPFDKKLVTFAYLSTVEPPVKDGKPICEQVIPDEALYIRYAPILADYICGLEDERQKEEVRRQIAGWSALTKNIMLWDYNVNYKEYFWYLPNLSYLKQNMKTYQRMGAHYIMKQGANNVTPVWHDDLHAYVSSKLFWDVNADVDELVREYVSLYFGPGADKVQAYIEEMESLYGELREQGVQIRISGHIAKQPYFSAEFYPLAMLQRQVQSLEEGILAVEHSDLPMYEMNTYIRRIKSVLLTPLRMLIKNAWEYFGEESVAYEEQYWRIADELGLRMSGEAVPIYMELASEGETTYKIIVGQNRTEEEQTAAMLLQSYVLEKTGALLPICTENAVYPAHFEHAIMVGKNLITNEFYKEGLELSDCSYFIEALDWCVFIDSDCDIVGAVQAFIDLCIRQGEGERSLEIKSCKRIGKR